MAPRPLGWPTVLTEDATLDELVRGRSLGRFGDGELKCAAGEGYRSQPPNPKLAAELRRILREPDPRCLPAIPTMDPRVTNAPFWDKHAQRFLSFLNRELIYGSAFIGRTDIAPWIDDSAYARKFRSIWAGKRVVLVAPFETGKARRIVPDAPQIACPPINAYDKVDWLETAVLALAPAVALLSAGPTATVLAHRLAVRGVQALDVGRSGRLLVRYPA